MHIYGMSSVRSERRRWIERVLSDARVVNQQELLERLRDAGVATTQATLSRDLADLGVVKGPDGWRMPDQTSLPPTELAPAVRAYLLSVEVGGTMVVLRTRTGHATPLAVELDKTRLEGALGTIAGDDTIFMAARSPANARALARRLHQMVAGEPRRGARR
jgi:transcriptional regulator of arginine metabolism